MSGLNFRDYISITAILVGLIGTSAGIYFSRKETPEEKASRDLDTLVASREALSGRVDSLEEMLEKIEPERNALKVQSEKCLDEIQKKTAELSTLQEQMRILGITVNSDTKKVQALQDYLMESRSMVSILTNQRNEMAQRFGVARSVSDITKGNADGTK